VVKKTQPTFKKPGVLIKTEKQIYFTNLRPPLLHQKNNTSNTAPIAGLFFTYASAVIIFNKTKY
jgi:hypothetical protein